MKNLITAIVITTTLATPTMADLSANIGFASEYYFRGILQTESSASAGVDFEQAGFYVGAWTADVDDGLEIDVYAGYGIKLDNGFSASVGATTYQFTGEFDTEYNEVNLNLGLGIVSLEVSSGKHDVDAGDDEDYLFAALTLQHNGFYGTYGAFTQDWDGDYLELGYGTDISGFDVGVALIFSQDDLGPEENGIGDNDEAIVFTLSKSFDLY